MSYSIGARASTIGAVEIMITAKLDEVIKQQPIHAKDREQALAAVNSFLGIMTPDDSKDVQVSLNGSVTWFGDMSAENIVGAGVSVSVWYVPRDQK